MNDNDKKISCKFLDIKNKNEKSFSRDSEEIKIITTVNKKRIIYSNIPNVLIYIRNILIYRQIEHNNID